MIKKMRKNKKGFTLIEIIVVLVIMGILLAIAVPAILGYVGKANDAKYLAQARGGYLAGQTIVAQRASDGTLDKANAETEITFSELNDELGLEDGDEGYITGGKCTISLAKKAIESCELTVDGLASDKVVKFTSGNEGKAEVVDATPAPAPGA